MKTNLKRILAVFLSLSLLLSMGAAIGPVFATADEQTSVSYNFDYQNAVDADGQNRSDGGNGLYKDGVISEKITGYMNDYYSDGILTWKYAGLSMSGNADFLKGYGMRACAEVNDWVAFWIKTPGAGTYELTLDYYQTKYGATASEVYIIPAITDAEDMNAAIAAALASGVKICDDLSFYNEAYTNWSPDKNDAASKVEGDTLGTWTTDSAATDYIVVFKATRSSAMNAYMYPVELTITEKEPEQAEEEEPEIYNFNYKGVIATAKEAMGASNMKDGGTALYDYVDTDNDSNKDAWVLRPGTLTWMDTYYGQTTWTDTADNNTVYDNNGEMILNWKYAGLSINETDTDNEVTFQNDTVNKGVRAYVDQGDWFAFYIKTPATGTYSLSLSHYLTTSGAKDATVYILDSITVDDADTTTNMNEAMNAAIVDAMSEEDVVSYKVGEKGFYGTADDGGGSSSNPQKNGNPAVTTVLGTWTADAATEHIVVFKANGTDSTEAANMYPAALTLTPVDPDDIIPDESDPDGSNPDESVPDESVPDEAAPTVTAPQDYNFDYQNAVDADGTDRKDGGADLYKDKTVSEKITGYMNTYYGDGSLNWKYAGLSASGDVTFVKDYSVRACTQVGDWIAFQIRTPGAGTYTLRLDYYASKYGASASDVYLIPAIKDAADMNAAIAAAMTQENRICSGLSFYNENYTQWTPNSNGAASKVEDEVLAIWEKTSSETDYILVFQAAGKTSSSAYMYPAALSLDVTKDTDVVPERVPSPEITPDDDQPEETGPVYPEGTAVYNFDYQNAVPDNLSDGGNGLYIEGVISEKITGYMNTYYADGTLNWKLAGLKLSGEAQFRAGYCLWAQSTVGDWIAFNIKNPGAGTYHVYLDYFRSRFGASAGEIYIIPAVSDAADMNAYIEAAMIEEYRICDNLKFAGDHASRYPENNGSVAKLTKRMGSWTAGDAQEYIVVFKATANSTFDQREQYGYMYPAQLILSKEELANADITVDSVIVAEDAARSATAQFTYVGQVNGHDYMFILMRDFKMLVYDIDTKQIVDIQTDVFNHPRNAVMDSKGILWVCGAANWLYRYDPVTGEGERITFSKELFPCTGTLSLWGMTLDENDNIYFGTSSSAYIGKYDQQTGEISRVSEWLNTSDTLAPDAFYGGYGGLTLRDGYIYMVIEGDQNGDLITTHQFIKYSLAENKIVDWVDVSECMISQSGQMRYVSPLGDDYIMLSQNSKMAKTALVDISGDKMKLVELKGMEHGCYGYVTKVVDGIAYCTGHSGYGEGLIEINTNVMWAMKLGSKVFATDMPKLLVQGDPFVTIEGDSRLPGASIVTYRNNAETGKLDLVFYNMETLQTVVWENIAGDEGTGNQLRNIITDPERKNIYTGAYGYNGVPQYNIAAGKVTNIFNTYDHQTDGLIWYDGYIYAGNYSKCSITRLNLETGVAVPLFRLNGTAFNQYRCHNLAAGDGKVFLGTTPGTSRLGGMLVWYDLDEQRTYVAAGPNPEDVYYADTLYATSYIWHRATTGEIVNFDEDGDGKEDTGVTVNGVLVPRFTGLIKDQTVNGMIYKDGYIYGTTTIYGGSGSTPASGNACMFVYDVAAMKVIATLDLSTVMSGFNTQIEWIDAIAEDPAVEGKFWGVVADTLFSFTFDLETATYTVKEELSMGKEGYIASGCNWDHRSIVFDGNYMYLVFQNNGTYMINRSNPQDCRRIAAEIPKQMVLGEDGNLYYVFKSADLYMLPVAENTQPLVLKSVQAMIDALPDAATEADISQIMAVRRVYDALIASTKAQVDITKLLAAEAATAEIRVSQVQAMIDALPDYVTMDDADAVRAAWEAYQALPEELKAMINAQKLIDAYNKLERERSDYIGTGDHAMLPLLFIAMAFSAGAGVLLHVRKKRIAA